MAGIFSHKHTLRFVLFLILAGICNLLCNTPNSMFNTVMFCANFIIYLGLILYWVNYVRKRILPTGTRTYITASSMFMIIYILQKVIRYRLIVDSVAAYRYMGYFYFIPLVMMPTLLLVTAIDLRYGSSRNAVIVERIILVMAAGVAAVALTNDIHHLVYVPTVDLSDFDMSNNTYSWGIGFYGIYGWIILSLVSGVALLVNAVSQTGKKAIVYLVCAVLAWLLLSLVHALVFERYGLPRPFFKPEIDCFCNLLIFECCIRFRLIPFNENYQGFFGNLKLPILITDKDLKIVHETAVPIDVSKDTLMKAKNVPVYTDEDTRLAAMKIRAGYAFWTENEYELRQERKRLYAANEILSEENDLIEVENKLKEKKAHLEAQNLVYERITEAIYPKQKKIEKILTDTDPGAESFPDELGKACVLNAYSKRKTNLLLLREDSLPESNRELFLALAESCRFLKCCGIDAAAVGEEYSVLPLKAVNELYDVFETVVETYLPTLSRMTVSVLPNGVRIAMEADKEQKLPKTSLPVDCKESDGILYITILSKEGGDAA
ncbi:MAG: hypothetical protein J5776_03815 [Clostridiales bacterium]|nr:hypothetical protein [Clostridiales bacterium]